MVLWVKDGPLLQLADGRATLADDQTCERHVVRWGASRRAAQRTGGGRGGAVQPAGVGVGVRDPQERGYKARKFMVLVKAKRLGQLQ